MVSSLLKSILTIPAPEHRAKQHYLFSSHLCLHLAIRLYCFCESGLAAQYSRPRQHAAPVCRTQAARLVSPGHGTPDMQDSATFRKANGSGNAAQARLGRTGTASRPE